MVDRSDISDLEGARRQGQSRLEAVPVRVGMVGTGFIARGFFSLLRRQGRGLTISKVLSRRPPGSCPKWLPEQMMTNSIQELIDCSDIIFECSGSTSHAATVLWAAGKAGLKLVTMNSEAQVTIGSALAQEGFYITEASGDQPGCLADLKEEAIDFGFEPLAYINLKGFLNLDPDPSDMQYWAKKQGLSVRSVTSFTDGSKLQIEQVFAANGLGARIAKQGMIGGTTADLADLDYLVEAAQELGAPISDYVVNPGGPPGVLILAASPTADEAEGHLGLSRLKTRKGLAYTLLRPHHLIHLEVPRTLRRVAAGAAPLLSNGKRPTATAAAVPKRSLRSGYLIREALGGVDVRSEAVELEQAPDAVPITLMDRARLKRNVEPGQLLTLDDVELEPSFAAELYFRGIGAQAEAGTKVAG